MSEPNEPLGFTVAGRVTLEDVGIKVPPPPAWLVAAWAKEPKPEWAVTIGEGNLRTPARLRCHGPRFPVNDGPHEPLRTFAELPTQAGTYAAARPGHFRV